MKKIDFHNKSFWITMVMGLLIFPSFSCKKFLEVQPRDYIYEEEVFSTKKGVESVLNGLYQSMSDSLLYGSALMLTATEQMAQYYYAVDGEHRNYFKEYMYTSKEPYLASIWSKSYRTILSVNNFCIKLENPSFNVIENPERNILLGEGYAIRAFMHFDMLRMYGPVYAKAPGNAAIPYVLKANGEAQPVLPASTVIENILSDLDLALKLLVNDPVRINGPNRIITTPIGESVNYLSNRHRRLNYFAVKTLQARVLLYAGKKELAYAASQTLIAEQEAFFPWETEQQMAEDPLLSRESYFGIENRKLYEYYRQLFSPLLNGERIYTPTQLRLDGIYNPGSTDLRLRYWYKVGVEGNKNYQVFIKHSNSTITDASIRYFQPLIKKSELYLIAAETATDLQQGYFYLNSLRLSRGLIALTYQPSNTFNDLLEEIRNEYQREFIGEGQTFFMFKRLDLSQITSYTGNEVLTMSDDKYVVPLPADETYYR